MIKGQNADLSCFLLVWWWNARRKRQRWRGLKTKSQTWAVFCSSGGAPVVAVVVILFLACAF